MNCKACTKVLGDYVDGELGARMAGHVMAHLESCDTCASFHEKIQYEQQVYAALGQHSGMSHPTWETVRSRIDATKSIPVAISFTPARRWFPGFQIGTAVAAGVPIAIISLILAIALINQKSTAEIPAQYAEIVPALRTVETGSTAYTDRNTPANKESIQKSTRIKPELRRGAAKKELVAPETSSFSAEKFRDAPVTTLEHIEKSQMLLRSFRNAPEDIAFEKRRFQRLLNRNVLLRCEAIAKGNLVEEEVLTNLEPILSDIANLPDHASPEEVRSITQTIKKTEIVAMLQTYSQTNNR